MTKWEKAKFNLANMSCDGCQFGYCPSDCDLRGCSFGETVGVALEALDMAERIEKLTPLEAVKKYCGENGVYAMMIAHGYGEALADVRGECDDKL